VCRGEEDAEKDDGDRAKYILRVTMANARKVQTVRLEKASEDQPLTGPPNEKLALTTKRLRGWKTDYEPPKGHERADYGGRGEEDREQEGDLYSSDEEGPVEAGQLDYDQGFRSDDEEAGSSGEGALGTDIVNLGCHRGTPLHLVLACAIPCRQSRCMCLPYVLGGPRWSCWQDVTQAEV
jgi:hypothetical protein